MMGYVYLFRLRLFVGEMNEQPAWSESKECCFVRFADPAPPHLLGSSNRSAGGARLAGEASQRHPAVATPQRLASSPNQTSEILQTVASSP